MGGKDTIIHSIQFSNLNRGVLGSVCCCGVRQRTMQSENALCSDPWESVTRNILNSLWILFWINFWLLDVEKTFTIAKILRTGTFSYMTPHGAVAHSLGKCALTDPIRHIGIQCFLSPHSPSLTTCLFWDSSWPPAQTQQCSSSFLGIPSGFLFLPISAWAAFSTVALSW